MTNCYIATFALRVCYAISLGSQKPQVSQPPALSSATLFSVPSMMRNAMSSIVLLWKL